MIHATVGQTSWDFYQFVFTTEKTCLIPQGYQVTQFDLTYCNSNIAKTNSLLPPTMTFIYHQWSARRRSISEPMPIDLSVFMMVVFCLLLLSIIAHRFFIITHLFYIGVHFFYIGIGTAVNHIPRYTDAAFPILAGGIPPKPAVLFQKMYYCEGICLSKHGITIGLAPYMHQ